jgi:hypothetical protein
VEAAAELDALMSLAAVAEVGCAQGPMCRPRLLPPRGDAQVLPNQASGPPMPSARNEHGLLTALVVGYSFSHVLEFAP